MIRITSGRNVAKGRERADIEINPIRRTDQNPLITMSFTKTLIAASYAIGAAVLLSLVVPDVPNNVLVDGTTGPSQPFFTLRSFDEPYQRKCNGDVFANMDLVKLNAT